MRKLGCLLAAAVALCLITGSASAQVDLQITGITDSPNDITLGTGNVQYFINTFNASAGAATNAQVIANLPTSSTYVSATPTGAGASCGESGGVVTCTWATYPSGNSFSVTIEVTPGVAGTNTLTANISATESDPLPGNNSDSENTTVNDQIDLAVTNITDSPTDITLGTGNVQYFINMFNYSTSKATGTVLTVTLPASATYVSGTVSVGSCSESGAIVTCTIGDYPSGASYSATITITPGAAGTNTLTAMIDATQPDPDNVTAGHLDTDSENTTVNDQIDLAVTNITDSPNDITLGAGNVQYFINMFNYSTSKATGTVLTVTLPASATYVSGTVSVGSCSESGGIVTCTIGDYPPGASYSATITITPGAAGTNTLTAMIDATQPDPDNATAGHLDTDSENTTVNDQIDLAVTNITDSPTDITLGTSNVQYFISMFNYSTSKATGTVLTVTLPASATYVSGTVSVGSCSESGGIVTCTIGDYPAGASYSATITITPGAAGTNTLSATISATQPDPDNVTAGHLDTDSENTTVNDQIDLAVTSITDSPNDITIGTGNVQYFINMFNYSTSKATGTVLTVTLPASATYVSGTVSVGSCSESGGIVTCTIGDYPSGAGYSATITITPGAAGTNTLTAMIDATQPDPDNVTAGHIDTDSENTTVNDQIDLAVTNITDSPNDITLGTGNVQYFISMFNYSTSKATNTVLTVTLPASATYVSGTVSVGSCSESGGIVTCTIGDYPSGASYSATITVTPGAAGTNTLTAMIDATQPDPDNVTAGHIDTDSENTTVNDQIDLAVTSISDSPDPRTLGAGNVQYFINMFNYSTSKATNTVLTVTLPASSAYVSGTVSVGSCSESGGVVTCTIGDYPSGASYSSTITVTPGVAGTNTLTATISATQPDPDNVTAGHLDTETETTTINPSSAPTITGFTPGEGQVNTPVTINGANFTGTTAVKFFNNISATFTVDDDSTISTNVPSGASTGNISITNGIGTTASAATFTVNPGIAVINTNDSGKGSLRDAITQANSGACPSPCAISFSIGSVLVSSKWPRPNGIVSGIVITPASPLPNITAANVTIDGTSDPSYAGSPVIELSGVSAGATASGLTLAGGGAVVRGLVIRDFTAVFPFGYAIYITSSNNTVAGNYLGTDVTGTAASPNRVGVVIEGASATGNTIGGLTAADRNIISGNNASGVSIENAATSNTVAGNYIGTDVTGTADLGNAFNGVNIENADGNTIGGTSAAERNVISGNDSPNINLWLSASGNFVLGNYVGTDASGTTALGNGSSGINLEDGAASQSTSGNTIGGFAAGAGNLVSGNAADGILLSGSGTDSNIVQGNIVGLDATGTAAITNSFSGITVMAGAQSNIIGGNTAGAGNVTSGNTLDGITVRDTNTNSNTVAGNYIGTNAAGTAAIPNGQSGVKISNGAQNNTIGGATTADANVISGNTASGVRLTNNNTTGNIVRKNIIGLDATAVSALGNGGPGVLIDNGAASNSIGGSGNKIANNNKGVVLASSAGVANRIAHNSIFSNTTIAIDLNDDGITANDGTDSDAGPNNLQNFPVISSAALSGSLLQFNATIDSSGSGAFGLVLDVYKADASSPEQAFSYLGSTGCLGTTLTNSPQSMIVSGLVVGDEIVVAATSYVTAACATVKDGTSELSAAATVAVGPPHWANPVSGNWNVGSNWTTGTPPAPGENAFIDAVGTYTVTLDTNATVLSVSVGSGATLSIPSPQTLTLTTGASSVASGGALSLDGGTLTGTGTMAVNGTFSFSSGTLSLTTTSLNGASNWSGGTLAGQLINSAGQTLTLSGSQKNFNTNGRLDNNGTVNWTAGAIFGNNNANAMINNMVGATWDVQADVSFTASCCTGPMITFENAGTFTKSGGTAATSFANFIVYNMTAGTTNVNAGSLALAGTGSASGGTFNVPAGRTLSLGNNYTFGASSTITAAGTVEFTAGSVTLNGTYSAVGATTISGGLVTFNAASTTNALTFSGGGLAGAGGLGVNGPSTWSGGTLAGKLINAAGQTMTLNGSTRTFDAGGQFHNNGIVNHTAGDVFGANNANAIINNNATGTWDIQADVNFTASCCTGPMLTINNSGAFTKSGGTSTTTLQNFIVFNMSGGSTNANAGTLAFNGTGGATGGTFNIVSGKTLSFGNNYSIGAAATVSGVGTFSVTGGAVTQGGTYSGVGVTSISNGSLSFTNPSTTNALIFSGGTLAGGGGVTVNGPSTWSGGTLAGKLTNASGQTMTLNGSTHMFDAGGQFENDGNVQWTTGDIFGANNADAVINNNAGSFFDIQADVNFTASCCTGPMLTVNNAGTFTKSGGTGTTTLPGFLVFNMTGGTTNVNAGAFAINGNGSATAGTFNIASGKTLSFGGQYTIFASAAVSGLGTFSITGGDMTVSGTYSGIGATSISNGAILFANAATTNALTFTGGTLTGALGLTVNGPTTWTGGTLAGKLTNASGQIMTMNGGTRTFGTGGQLENDGTINWTFGDNFGANSANAVINNNAGSLFDIQADVNFTASCCTGPMLTVNNAGAFTKSAGAGMTTLPNFIVFNMTGGTTNVNAGTLAMNGSGSATGGTFNIVSGKTLSLGNNFAIGASATVAGLGTFAVTGGAVTQGGTYTGVGATSISGGSLSFTAASTTNALTLSGGTLGGGGGLTVNGPSSFTGGSLAGKLTNASGQTMTMNGGNRTFDAGGQLENDGTINWTFGDNFGANNANAVINNNTGALFDIQADVNFTASCCTGPMLTVNNAGTFTKSGGASSTTFPNFIVFNQTGGSTNVNDGALALNGSGTATGGTFAIAATRVLSIGGNNFNFSAGSTISGLGRFIVNGGIVSVGGTYTNVGGTAVSNGTLTFNAASSTNDFTFSGGTLAGTGGLTVNGPTTWSGGTLAGKLINPAGQTMTLNSGTHVFGGGGQLDNNGTINWTAGNTEGGNAANAFINNNAGGLFDIQGDLNFTQSCCTGPMLTFNNAGGTLRKSAGNVAGTAFPSFLVLSNNGTLDLQRGFFNISGGYTQPPAGILSIAVGGTTAGTDFGVLTMTGNASLAGTLNVNLGFTPANGSSFQITTYGSNTGPTDFATKNGLTFPGGTLNYGLNATNITLTTSFAAGTSIVKTAPASVAASQTFNYTLTVTNGGPDEAIDLSVSDTLPAGVTWNSTTAPGWTCGAPPTIVCTMASLAPGSSVITFNVTAPSSPAALSNTATVFATNDSTGGDNSSTANTNVTAASADLGVTKVADAASVVLNGTITYTITVENFGPSLATNVVMSDLVPTGQNITSATSTQGSCSGAPTVNCTIGSLLVGNPVTITIVVNATLGGTQVNTASVTADESDPNGANNSASATVAVTGATTLVVLTAADSGNGSLRQAILDVNNGVCGPPCLIAFALSPVTPIVLASQLPAITAAQTTIDGTTQSGYAGTPLIHLDGASCGACGDGITFNASQGVLRGLEISGFTDAGAAVLPAAVGVRILDDSFHDNGGLGIDLDDDGPTANDAGDPDTGGNNRQNKPVLNSAVLGGGTLFFDFSVDSGSVLTTNSLRVDFFRADGSGEGQQWIASNCYATRTLTNQTFTTAGGSVVVGNPIVAAATSYSDPTCNTPNDGTSEFSTPVNVNSCVAPAATITAPASACANTTGHSASVSPTAGASYFWSITNGTIDSGAGTNAITFTAGASGTTTLNVSVTYNGCSNGGTASVAINPPPTANVSGSTTICAGSSTTISATLTGTAPFNILWSDGVPQTISSGTTASRIVSPASTTTYTITSIGDANCSGTSSGSATVTVIPTPTAIVSGSAAFCAGGSATITATLTGTAPFNLLWSDGVPQTISSGSTASRVVSPSSTTTYTLTTFSDASCSGTTSGSATLTVNPPPVVTITGPTATCASTPVTLDAGAGFASYLWSPGGQTTQQITVSPSSSTIYTVVVTDGNGCSGNDSHTVNVSANPIATINAAASVCASSTGNAASVAAQGGATYSWSITGGTITTGQNTDTITFSANASGNVVLGVTVNVGACTSTGSSTIPISTPPAVTITGPTLVCPNTPFTLDAGPGFLSYQWSTGHISQQIPVTQSASSVTYTVIVTDANGCSATDTHTVNTITAPSANITAPTDVDPDSAGHSASVPLQGGATYNWSISNGAITSGNGTNSITFTAGSNGTVDLTVDVTASGCTSTGTVSIPINGTQPPQNADFSVSKTAASTVQAGASLTYTIIVSNAGPIGASASLTDNLPTGVTFNNLSGGAWSCAPSVNQVQCNGFLAAGASNTILITVTAPQQPGTITNSVSVSSAADADPSNNIDSVSTLVTAKPTVCATTPPSLLAPANNATVTSPVPFSWTAIDGATLYELWLINDGNTLLAGSTTNTSITLAVPSGTSQWFVVARLGTGCDALVSAQRTFNVQQADNCSQHGAPQITSPSEGAVVTSPAPIGWTAVPQAIGYRVWIEVDGTAPQDVGTTDGAISLNVQVPPGAIKVYVDALFGGCPPTRSAPVNFTVPAPDPCANRGAATLVAPANNAVLQTSSVGLQWLGAANASEHRVWASINGATPEVLGTTTDESLHVHISDGDVVWWIEELFDGCASTESARFRFVIPPNNDCATDRPETISPADGATVTNGEVTFDWTNVAGAIGYDVYLAVANGTPALIGSTIAPVTSLTHFVPAGELEWTVVAKVDRCPDRESQKARFTFDPPPACEGIQRAILIAPLDGETTTAPTAFDWNAPLGATRFELYAMRGNSAPVLLASTTSDDAPAINLATGKLRWFVRTFFGVECAPLDSEVYELEIAAQPSPCSELTAPVISAPGEISSGIEFLIQWSSSLGATGYQLQIASNANFEGAQFVSTGATSHALTRTNDGSAPLAVFARVRAIDSRCTPLPAVSPYGPTSAIFILPEGGTAGSVPLGESTIVEYTITLGPELAGQTFTAIATESWLTVTPVSGVVGAGGTTLHVQANTAGLGIGANTGSVVITLNSSSGRVQSNPTTTVSTPISVSLVTPVTPAPKNTPPPDALIIPAVANADGINSHFQSDVRVSNTSPQLIKYQLTYIPTGEAGITAGRQTTFSVEPGRTVALDDILKTWFGTGTSNSQGSLEIRPLTQTSTSTSSAAIGALANLVSFASSRTFNSTPNGTFGQYIPAVPFANFLGKASGDALKSVLSLQQIAQSAKYRTNLGLLEASGESASLLIKVFGGNGQPITSFPVNLNGGQHTQLNAFLWQQGITLEDGRVEVEVVSGNGKVTAYASVLDNETSDAVLVTPVSLSDKGNTKWVVPGVADIKSGFADWQTDMRIFNADTASVEITATFYSQNPATAPKATTITLAAGEVKQLDKILPTLFNVSGDGGALHLSTATAARLIATARTYNQTSTGTYGQFISAVTPLEAVGVGSRPLQLLQVEESSRFRSNIGFAETTGKPVKLEVTVTPPDAKFTASAVIDLGANEFRQIGSMLKGILGPNDVYNARISVRAIAGEGRATAYASVIDLKTNDPTYNPAQ